jgi:hypothetical protein
MRWNTWLIVLGPLLLLACTTTAPIVSSVQHVTLRLSLSGARVAVLSFGAAPAHPETGRAAREIATGVLVQRYGVSLISPSRVEAYLKEHSVTPSEFDREALEVLARSLGAEIILWGSVNQFTPYRFGRLAPATPPYVDLTLLALRVGDTGVAKASGRKRGGLPLTIWNRQPTFDDVAQPLIVELLGSLR